MNKKEFVSTPRKTSGSPEKKRPLSPSQRSSGSLKARPAASSPDTQRNNHKREPGRGARGRREGGRCPPRLPFESDKQITDGAKCEDDGNALLWNSPAPYVPLEVEEDVVETLVRWKKTERGMIKDQPKFRLDQIKRKCRENGWKISLPQALSLRRHHMKLLNPYKSMSQLKLGSENDIRESAQIFEEALEAYLVSRGVQVWTEAQQRKQCHNARCTPDFLLPNGGSVLVKKVRNAVVGRGSRQRKRVVLEQQVIHWIEAKMFYGASTIPHGSNGAVGNLMATAQKYVATFGPGAMVFMYGCGVRLAAELKQVGVLVLDCSDSVPLVLVEDHQRTWCANRDGDILP